METPSSSIVANVIRTTRLWIENSELTYADAASVARRAVGQVEFAGGNDYDATNHATMAVLQACCEAGPSTL